MFALIKFLNQLSEQDKVAAIKFLITTLKASTKEHFSKSRKSNRGYTFGQNTDVEQWLVADVIEKKSPPTDTEDDYDDCDAHIDDLNEEQFHIQLDDFANSGAFGNQALIPVIEQRSNDKNAIVLSREQRKTNIVQHLLNENSRYELNVHKLFGLSRNFLKSIFNDFIFEHWIDGKLLVKQQRMLGDIPATATTINTNTNTDITTASASEIETEATLTELGEEGTEQEDSDRELSLNDVDDEIATPTNQSGMSAESVNHQIDPLETAEESDLVKVKPKPARKTKLYTCFQCPKVYVLIFFNCFFFSKRRFQFKCVHR